MSLVNYFIVVLFTAGFDIVFANILGCPRPIPRPVNGEVSTYSDHPSVIPEGEVVYYSCDDHYQLRDHSRSVCTDGKFEPGPPLCYRVTCPDSPVLVNGSWSPRRPSEKYFKENNTIKAVCLDGYKLRRGKGSKLLRCRRNGTELEWFGILPECQELPSCGDPGVSINGYRLATGFYAGKQTVFSCEDRFILVGKSIITCGKEGKWDHPRPRCKPDLVCPDLPELHGSWGSSVRSDYFISGDTATLKCDEGYQPGGEGHDILNCIQYVEDDEDTDSNSTEVMENSIEERQNSVEVTKLEWDDHPATCEVVTCSKPRTLKNGFIHTGHQLNGTFPYKSRVTYKCKPNFLLLGSSWSECQASGWTPRPPECKEIFCPDIPVPENGFKSGVSRRIGGKVSFVCHSGFVLTGSAERTCLENGFWDGDLVTCTPTSSYCQNPGIPVNGNKDGTNYDLGDTVKFSCKSGYALSGSETRVCLEDGTWSGEETRCRGNLEFDRTDEASFRLLNGIDEKMVLANSFIHTNNTNNHGRLTRSIDLNYGGNLVIYFVFDSSKSIGEENFKSARNFAMALVERVKVSENGVRIGAVIFNETANVLFNPLDFVTTESVLEELKKVKYAGGGGTATTPALRKVQTQMNTANHRLNSPKFVVILMTDGVFNIGGSPKEPASDLRKKNRADIYCIAVAGSKGTNQQVLLDIVGKKSKNIYVMKEYSTLSWIVDHILNGSIDYSRCGVPVVDQAEINRGRIGGHGRDVEDDKYWPWMAALYYKNLTKLNYEEKLSCGGSIFDREWIITAAHCLYVHENSVMTRLRGANEVLVKLGLTHVDRKEHQQPIEVKNIYLHPKWSKTTFDYDVALLHLNRPADYKHRIRPICLSPHEKDLGESSLYNTNEQNVVIGFGRQENSQGLMSKNLREANVTLQPREKCVDSVKRFNYTITNTMICAGDGSIDTCKGDSGGPLMKKMTRDDHVGDVYWVQVGIVSWGVHNQKYADCGIPGFYGYYTKMSTVVDWIKETRSKY